MIGVCRAQIQGIDDHYAASIVNVGQKYRSIAEQNSPFQRKQALGRTPTVTFCQQLDLDDPPSE
jgi:hypothetical protein